MFPRHEGETLHIVGKGPSLAHLKAEHFGDGPILALNQSVLDVLALGLPNTLYSMQKDGCSDVRYRPAGMCDTCDGTGEFVVPVPDHVTLILHDYESGRCQPNHPRRIVFSAYDWFGNSLTPSAPCAGRIATLMGVSHAKLLCFDALKGDERVHEPWGVIDYGGSISYIPANTRMLEELTRSGIGYTLVYPDGGDNDL